MTMVTCTRAHFYLFRIVCEETHKNEWVIYLVVDARLHCHRSIHRIDWHLVRGACWIFIVRVFIRFDLHSVLFSLAFALPNVAELLTHTFGSSGRCQFEMEDWNFTHSILSTTIHIHANDSTSNTLMERSAVCVSFYIQIHSFIFFLYPFRMTISVCISCHQFKWRSTHKRCSHRCDDHQCVYVPRTQLTYQHTIFRRIIPSIGHWAFGVHTAYKYCESKFVVIVVHDARCTAAHNVSNLFYDGSAFTYE